MQNKTAESKAVAIGIKGGVNFPRMYYTDNPSVSQLPQDWYVTPMGGVFVDIPLGSVLTMSPEFVYLQRGTKLSYTHQSGADVHYSISAHFVDFRLPFELRWPVNPYLQPYLVVGGEVGMPLGGQIHMDHIEPANFDQDIDLSDANMNIVHAGAFAGLGIRSRIGLGSRDMVLKLSATWHQGLLNNFSAAEQDGTATAINVNAYQPKGARLPQGLEVCLGISFPLERQDDACATFSKDRYRRHGGKGLFGF